MSGEIESKEKLSENFSFHPSQKLISNPIQDYENNSE